MSLLRFSCAALLVGLVTVAGCGDDETEGSGGSGGSGASSSSSSSSSGTGASTSSSSSSSSSSGSGGEGNVGNEGGMGGVAQGGAGGDAQGGAGGGLGGSGQGGGGAGQGGSGGGGNDGTCAMPIAVTNPQTVTGDTTGATAQHEPDGCATAGSGNPPEQVFALTPTTTGTIDITLSSSFDAVLYIRTTCDTATSEIECKDSSVATETATIAVTTGQVVYLIVDGYDDTEFGTFTLDIDPQETNCGDGLDDDANGLIDCEDPDCSANAACPIAATCAGATPLSSTGSNTGDTTTGTDDFAATCTGNDLANESLFSYTAAATGMLQLTLQSATDQGVYVRTDCDDASTQIACKDAVSGGTDEVKYVGVVAGQTLAIFVDGFSDTASGPFTLLNAFTPVTITETEPNDTSATADAYAAPYVGMRVQGDSDWVSVTVPGPTSTITAETVDAVAGACAANSVDTFVYIYGTDGTTELDTDEDGGAGWCSLASATGLAAGTYYVRVDASSFSAGDQFAYQLNVTVTP